MRSNLTINAGVRYEMLHAAVRPQQPADQHRSGDRPDRSRPRTAASSTARSSIPIATTSRRASAWRGAPTPRLVLRGGYGVFYQQTDRYGSESQLGLNLPQLVDASITANSGADAAGVHVRAGLHAARRRTTVNPAVVQWRIQDPNQDTPIVQQFSIGPEVPARRRTWWPRSSTSATARATAGGCATSTKASSSARRRTVVFPYAQYGFGNAYLEQIVTNGRADYNSLQMRMQKRMSGGLAYTLAYTWSKALGDFLDHLSAGGGATGNVPRIDLRDGEATTARSRSTSRTASWPASSTSCRSARAAASQPSGVAGRDRRRLVGERHPDAQRRPAVHGHRERPGQHRPGPHRARQLRRRRGARRLRPDARRVVRRRGVRADRRVRTYGNCANNTVRGPESKSMNMSLFRIDRARRRASASSCASRPSTCSTGSTTASRRPTCRTSARSAASPARSATRARCSWRSSSISRGRAS